MSRLEALEARIEKLEKELALSPPIARDEAEDHKWTPEPTHDFLRGSHDWRSDPGLYSPGLRWRIVL